MKLQQEGPNRTWRPAAFCFCSLLLLHSFILFDSLNGWIKFKEKPQTAAWLRCYLTVSAISTDPVRAATHAVLPLASPSSSSGTGRSAPPCCGCPSACRNLGEGPPRWAAAAGGGRTGAWAARAASPRTWRCRWAKFRFFCNNVPPRSQSRFLPRAGSSDRITWSSSGLMWTQLWI